ncbi:MAG: peptidoglycan DD-metalloendopeptidase family protein [Candidatus Paceibacterota bacterium]|jgi:murein DD-endopeptidase MepM/ murein hydrolase activator NlpD
MKLYYDYKKQFKILLLIILLVIPIAFSYAQTAAEIQSQINQKDADIKKIEQEIAIYQSQLDNLGQQKSSLNSSLKALDLNKKKLNADITITQKKIDKTNFTIQNLSSDISNKEDSIENNINSIKFEIKNIEEFEQTSLVENMLSSNDMSVIWNDIDNIVTIRERLRADIIVLKQTKGILEDTRKVTIDAKNELSKLKSKLSDQQKIVAQNTKEKSKLLAQTKNSEANYQKILKDKLAQKNAIEKELRDYESQLKYILDPSKLPNAGVFSWPLDYVFITQLFGKTVDSKRLYVSGSHGGVDFRASVGTPVKAMAAGVVAGIGDTDVQCPGASFGKFVFIKYDNGLSSAFGHLSLIKANVGERVARGTVVAYSGNTGYSTGPHLHVSVYAPNAAEVKNLPSKSCPGKSLTQPIAPTNAYLDPMYYLPSTNSSMFK